MNKELIIKKLRAQNYRLTKGRVTIIEVFCEQPCALAVKEITSQLREKAFFCHLSTIYREIEMLKKEKIIDEVDFGDGQKRYELHLDKHHHHHLFCTQCQNIIPFKLEPRFEKKIESVAKNAHFNMTSHDITLQGICDRCEIY